MAERFVETEQGNIAIAESAGSGPPILMIHGNSSCKEVFRNQLEGPIGEKFHCISMDLPGHGHSDDARDPDAAYSMPGYADIALELMSGLGHNRFAMLGWSLGGHIGLEVIAKSDVLTGLMITGSPPVGMGEEAVAAGFKPSEHMHLAGQRHMSDEEVDAYSRATCGVNAPFEEFLRTAVARTDGRARELMLSKFIAGTGCNQKEIAEHSPVVLAIVNGGAEPFVNNDYVTSLTYDNLWENQVHLIDGVGHAPFWESPDIFDEYLNRFLKEVWKIL